MEKEKSSTSVEKTIRQELSGDQQILEVKPIENTPFTAVKVGEYWFLALGKYRISGMMQTFAECEKDAKDASWERIMTVINVMIQDHERRTEEQRAASSSSRANDKGTNESSTVNQNGTSKSKNTVNTVGGK